VRLDPLGLAANEVNAIRDQRQQQPVDVMLPERAVRAGTR
jgi:hypothetical protein